MVEFSATVKPPFDIQGRGKCHTILQSKRITQKLNRQETLADGNGMEVQRSRIERVDGNVYFLLWGIKGEQAGLEPIATSWLTELSSR